MSAFTESQQQQPQEEELMEVGSSATDPPPRDCGKEEFGGEEPTKARFNSVTELDPKASQCYTCLKCWGNCEVHDRRLRRELGNYFSGPFNGECDYGEKLVYWASERFRRQHPRESSPPRARHAVLGSRLVGFCENFSDCRYEDQDRAVLEHGKLDVKFDADTFDLGCDPYLRDHYRMISGGDPYFHMDAIYSAASCGDMFFCLFQDGKYYFCDYADTCETGPKEDSYAWKLQHLVEVIDAQNKKNAATA